MDIEQRAENISNLIASILDTHNDHDMLQIHELSFAWAMLEYMNENHSSLVNTIEQTKVLDDDSREQILEAIDEFKKSYQEG